MQLVSTVATDLKLPTRVSPPYSQQSQGKVERFHRNLFDQLRTTKITVEQRPQHRTTHVAPQSHYPGNHITASSYSTTTSCARQGRHLTSRTTATTTAPTSCTSEKRFLETSVIWKLHRALYGLRTSPKTWQEHLHSTLRRLQLQQLKSDRCIWVMPNLMVLADIDDLLIAGIKGDIIVSGATSTIIQLETLYSPYNTTTTSLSGKAHLQTSEC